MKILITGAGGFLGFYLVQQLLEKGHTVIATAKGDNPPHFETAPGFSYYKMDVTDRGSVETIFTSAAPDVVVHAGAMSKPDVCETEREKAWRTNVDGTIYMLEQAAATACHFIFVSSDFVFSGENDTYREEDETGPVNYYGHTKATAEKAVQQYLYDWSIVRTVLVYGYPVTGKANIMTVVKDKLESGTGYNVFGDQLRTPTYVEDLAAGIVAIIEKRAKGIYHLAGVDKLTPYDIAFQTAGHLGLDTSLLRKVVAAEFPQPAKRPPRTCFDISKARHDLNYRPVSFREGLQKTFANGIV